MQQNLSLLRRACLTGKARNHHATSTSARCERQSMRQRAVIVLRHVFFPARESPHQRTALSSILGPGCWPPANEHILPCSLVQAP